VPSLWAYAPGQAKPGQIVGGKGVARTGRGGRRGAINDQKTLTTISRTKGAGFAERGKKSRMRERDAKTNGPVTNLSGKGGQTKAARVPLTKSQTWSAIGKNLKKKGNGG